MSVEVVDVSQKQLEAALSQVKAVLPPAVFEPLDKVVRAYSTLVKAVEGKNMTLSRLRRMLFGPSSEKSRQVLAAQGRCEDGKGNAGAQGGAKTKAPAQPGHGRNGQEAYRNAQTELVGHQRLTPGDACPGCRQGKVYEQRDRPGILVRVTGQPPLAARIFHLQKLRCNLCLQIYEARPPEGVGRRKYDQTAASMIALFKYGGGFPWSRLYRLQGALGVPLSPSTQWEVVREAAGNLLPAHEQLERLAAQGKVLHNDDTTMKILAWMGKRRQTRLLEASKGGTDDREGEAPSPGRTGIFTSGILSQAQGRQIALFFTGVKHAGENLKALLDKRARGLRPPIQMCDALSRNFPKSIKTFLAKCLAHGRRQFVELADSFPLECGHILGLLAKVYKNDAIAKKREITDFERLKYHQAKSAPLMEKLHAWLQAQFAQKKVEPNSNLGLAIGYMLKHWEELTLFLKRAGAPLDNNICERALKRAILHRKNSLFYKTDNGARVGDVYMSLIQTCDLNGADPFDYLTQLQRHAKEVRAQPEQWMPWNYRKALPRARSP